MPDLSCVSHMPCLVILDASHNEISTFFDFEPPKKLKVKHGTLSWHSKTCDCTLFIHKKQLYLWRYYFKVVLVCLQVVLPLLFVFIFKEVNFSYNRLTEMKSLSAYESLSKLSLDCILAIISANFPCHFFLNNKLLVLATFFLC